MFIRGYFIMHDAALNINGHVTAVKFPQDTIKRVTETIITKSRSDLSIAISESRSPEPLSGPRGPHADS